MDERLDRHWREMDRLRARARAARRRFAPPQHPATVEELHLTASALLEAHHPRWRALSGSALAAALNALGLKTYGGRAFEAQSASDLRRALTLREQASTGVRQRAAASLIERFSALIPRLERPWTREVHREAAWLLLAVAPDEPDPVLQRARRFVAEKLEAFRASSLR